MATRGRTGKEQVIAAKRLERLVAEALSGLEADCGGRLAPTEAVCAELLRQAARRLVECAEQITADGLVVAGSMKQLRPHPLLSQERALRKEIDRQLPHPTF